MKANSTQMEIMILTGTHFSASQAAEKTGDENAKPGRSDKEILTEACWNGMLGEILPELCEKIPEGKKIYLWDIKEAEAFIELELGEYEEDREKYYSINPYSFITEHPLS